MEKTSFAETYGARHSADGAVLYVNFNGHAADSIRPASCVPTDSA